MEKIFDEKNFSKKPLMIEYLALGGSKILGFDKIKVENLLEPDNLEAGESMIALMRNGADDRTDPNSPEFGALKQTEAEKIKMDTAIFCDKIFEKLSPEERKECDFMVMSGTSKLIMPDGNKSSHSRTLDSGRRAIEGIRETFKKYNLSEQQLLTGEDPIGLEELGELKMLEDSSAFVDFLVKKYGTGKEFWVAYEEDLERKTRLAMGVEGPEDISDRVNKFLKIIEHNLKIYHKKRSDRKIIVLAYGTYDILSPWYKQHVLNVPSNKYYMPIEHRGGIAISKQNVTFLV